MSEKESAPHNSSLNYIEKLFFGTFFIFSLYYLIRDIAQMMGVRHQFINVLHTQHAWCGSACDVVTLPLDVLGIVGSLIVLKRQFVGMWGIILMGTIPLWLLFMWLP